MIFSALHKSDNDYIIFCCAVEISIMFLLENNMIGVLSKITNCMIIMIILSRK